MSFYSHPSYTFLLPKDSDQKSPTTLPSQKKKNLQYTIAWQQHTYSESSTFRRSRIESS